MASEHLFGSKGHPTNTAKGTSHLLVGGVIGAVFGGATKNIEAAIIMTIIGMIGHEMLDAPVADLLAESGI